MIDLFVLLFELWWAIGLLVALAFVIRGLGRVDATAEGAGWGLRLILIPASALLWPWVLWRWMRSPALPVECTGHRCAVEGPRPPVTPAVASEED